MKRQLLIFILLLLDVFFTSASGQDTKFTIAAEGGPSLTNLITSKQFKKYFIPVLGGYAGILVQYNLSQYFSLRSGLTYERTGTNFVVDTYDIKVDYTYFFDYLTIPVMVRMQYGGKVRLYGTFGPFFSLLLSQQYFANGGEQYYHITPDTHTAIPINRNRIDFGIIGGVGMEIKILSKATLTIGVSDFYGLCNTKKQPPYTNDGGIGLGFDSKTYNNSAIFLIGCSVNIGKTK